MELWQQREVIKKQLDDALKTLRGNGIEYCEAERLYQIEKSKEIMRLKNEGYPATLILGIVKGLENIAELDFNRNKSEVVYKANQEAINIKKLELKSLESDIAREWTNAKDE